MGFVNRADALFVDRADAGRRLAEALVRLRDEDIVVLGLPRGGVPVAFEVAKALGAPLDVIVVRKLGVPFQPELGMGAIGEDGVRIVNERVVRLAGLGAQDVATVEARERVELEQRALRFRGDRPRVDLAGRTAVIVDDGMATGSTARAACRVARAQGATRIVLAVPVAPSQAAEELLPDADEVICLATPAMFFAIGQFYADFSQTSDAEVIDCLARAGTRARSSTPAPPRSSEADPPGRVDEVKLRAGGEWLAGQLNVPAGARGVVVFAHGSGSSRHSPRNRFVASVLRAAGLGTLLFDLLTPDEELDRGNVFDVELLAERLADATGWLRAEPESAGARIGYFGASTGAAAALWAAADSAADIGAVVSRGGRPDLAGPRLAAVRAPTLLIVGGADHEVLELNRWAQERLRCENRLAVVPGATHLFEERGTLSAAADLAREWFVRHLERVAVRGGARVQPGGAAVPRS